MSEERKYTGFAAIYQIEQEKLKREKAQPPQVPTDEPEGRAAEKPAPAEASAEKRLDVPDAAPYAGAGESSESPTGAATPQEAAPAAVEEIGDGSRARVRPAKPRPPRRGTQAPKPQPVSAPASVADDAGVESHAARWKQVYRLNKGEIKVMKVMFGLSHARGTDVCYIKVGEVADAARLKKRRCQYVIRSLETLGFLDRLGEYDPSSRLGLQYRMHLKPVRLESE
ncbi:MAG: hypothetical protein QOJ70_1983 [Acidobacteriota bacterium]|nr:hypothetical protein [Acidobacteriota bacterium]